MKKTKPTMQEARRSYWNRPSPSGSFWIAPEWSREYDGRQISVAAATGKEAFKNLLDFLFAMAEHPAVRELAEKHGIRFWSTRLEEEEEGGQLRL